MLDHSRLLSVWSILAELFFHLLETLVREIQGEKALEKENSVLYSL